MDKKLQDLTWSVLPKEFKEEVKKLYVEIEVELSKEKGVTDNRTCQYRGMKSQLASLFGAHNLTSDAEGEDEMLYVSRKRLQDAFNSAKIIGCSKMSSKTLAGAAGMCINTFKDLFGSKCLPDEAANEDNFASKEPKPTGPKYRKGEKVCYNGYVYEIEGLVGKDRYALKGLNFDLDEDMIDPYEPYTEPLSQNPPENCNNAVHISTECDKPAEPEEDLIPSNSGELKSQVADNQSHNLSKKIRL